MLELSLLTPLVSLLIDLHLLRRPSLLGRWHPGKVADKEDAWHLLLRMHMPSMSALRYTAENDGVHNKVVSPCELLANLEPLAGR